MAEPITALMACFKILRAIVVVVDGLDEVREQDRALKYLSVTAQQFLELVNKGLQNEDASPFIPTIELLKILLEDIFSTAQEYRLMKAPSRLLRVYQTKRKLIALEKRLSKFRDIYLIQSATELRISLDALRRSPSSFNVAQPGNSINDDVRWEIMTERGGSTVGGSDRVWSWLGTLRGQTWESETAFTGDSADDTSATATAPAKEKRMQDKKWSPLPGLPETKPLSINKQAKATRPAGAVPIARRSNPQPVSASTSGPNPIFFIVIAVFISFLVFQEKRLPITPPAIEVKPSCLSMIAFQAHDKSATEIGEGVMEQLISASRRYQKACESFDMKDTTDFFNSVSDAIDMLNKAMNLVPRHAKEGLRKNLAIMYTCRASVWLSYGDTWDIEDALRDSKSAEKQDPSLNIAYWYKAAAQYRKGQLSVAQDTIARALRRVDLKDDAFLVDKLIMLYTDSAGPPAELALFRDWLQEITQRNKRSKSRLQGIQGEWKRYIDDELEKRINTTFDDALPLEELEARQTKLQLYMKAIDGMADLFSRQERNSPNRTRLSVKFAKMYNHRAKLWLSHNDAFSAEAALRDAELAEKYNAGSPSSYINQAVALDRLGRLSKAKDVVARALKRTDLEDDEKLVDLLTRLYNPDGKIDLSDDKAFKAWWEEITVKDKSRLKGIKGKWKARADARLPVQKGFW